MKRRHQQQSDQAKAAFESAIAQLKAEGEKKRRYNNIVAIVMTVTFVLVIIIQAGFINLWALSEAIDKWQVEPPWDESVAAMTDKDLLSWLKKAPFDHIHSYYPTGLNPRKASLPEYQHLVRGDTAQQFFPFMGNFYNAEKILFSGLHNGEIFEESYVVYQDPTFGEVFLYAILTFKNEELFVTDQNVEFGNVLLNGPGAIRERYQATLYETQVVVNNKDYKTVIYKATTGYKKKRNYLFATYQRANLALQIAIPLPEGGVDNTAVVIDKLNQTAQALGLTVNEWNSLTVDALVINANPQSFWQAPYYGLNINTRWFDAPNLQLRLALLPFTQQNDSLATMENFDYYFVYTSDKGEVKLGINVEESALSKADYFAQHPATDIEYKANAKFSAEHKVFVTEKTDNKVISGVAETYFENNTTLKFSYSYPVADVEAKANIKEILTHLKIDTY